MRRYRADVIDQQVINGIVSQVFNTRALRQLAIEIKGTRDKIDDELDKIISMHDREIKNLQRRNKNIMDVIESVGISAPNIRDLTDKLRKNSESIDSHKIKIRQARQSSMDHLDLDIDIPELSEILREIVTDQENVELVRAFLTSILKKVVIGEGQIKVDYAPDQIFSEMVRKSSGWLPGPSLMRTKKLIIDNPEVARRSA